MHYNEVGELVWTEFSSGNIPPYAILSHTWGTGEVSFEDLMNNRAKSKAGYRKILFCGEQAARDHLQYFWVDTCCIDKRNFHELSKAINSMFRWYQTAAKCYVFLSDVSTPSITDDPLYQSIWEAAFRESRWFTRGWTLQELIAPASVEFFSLQHQRLGDKQSLKQQIFEISGVPLRALQGHPLNKFSVEERMAWAAKRRTSEEEDGAYCLLGIFGVFMPLIYGEGRRNAFVRLKEEIGKKSKVHESEGLSTEFMSPEKVLAGTHKNRPSEHAQRSLRIERNPEFDVGLSGYLNILILGETGVGKSTFINALVNYLEFETLDDALDADTLNWVEPCNFSIQITDGSNPDQDIVEKSIQVGSDLSEGCSATPQNTVYHVTFSSGPTIRLIDMPSIGDTRGVEYDMKNMANILTALSSYDKLHGILILLKSNARLTNTFKYCVKELLTYLHRSAAQNIVFGFTHTRISNYTPGDTFRLLKRLLSENPNVGLTLSTNTTYCFDSESFRYLAASKSSVKIPNKEDFDQSWKHSRDETVRLMIHFKSVPPHQTKNSLSLNRVREIILELEKPMADISQLIRANTALYEDRKAELKDKRLTANQLRKNIHIQKIQLNPEPLDQPRTVCANIRCTEIRDDGNMKTVIYKTHCHSPCYLDDVSVDRMGLGALINCPAFDYTGYCRKCSHHWQEHMHIIYELKEYSVTLTDRSVEQQLKACTDDIALQQTALSDLDQRIKEYKEEQSTITLAAAKLGLFLKKNSITLSKDPTIEYLDLLITHETDKVMVGASVAELLALKEDLERRKETVQTLTRSMNVNANAVDLSEAGVESTVRALYDLKHFGENFRSLKRGIY